ncbi:MAG TPA: diacylglycerol kinase family protein [Methylophilaceae bacterium]|nr:diacylglycerol kinase family protein [Methylophilaceae bacterium]
MSEFKSDSKFFIMLNAKSGNNDHENTQQKIKSAMQAAGREYELILIDDAAKLQQIAKETLKQVLACDGVLVIAGGDGAINAVSQVVAGSGCKFGVLPHGTFNYFSRTHRIPGDTDEALQVLINDAPEPVQTGVVNERIFLVNASVGLYPEILEERETNKRRYGRSRFVAFMSGIVSIFSRQRLMRLTIVHQGQSRDVVTQTLFVGNNALQMEQVGIPLVDAIGKDRLAAVMLKPVSALKMLGIMLRSIAGRLGEAPSVDSFSFSNITIKPTLPRRLKRIKVATDGEILWMNTPLEFRVWPDSLLLIKPRPAVETQSPALEPALEAVPEAA